MDLLLKRRIGALAFLTSLTAVGGPLLASGARTVGESARREGQDLVKWRSISKGEAEARSKRKPILYFFTAEWCGPCHTLKQKVFSQPAIAEVIHRDFIPVVVEDRFREEGRNSEAMLKLASQFDLRGFPTLVVSRPGGRLRVKSEGWESENASVRFLTTARKSLEALEK